MFHVVMLGFPSVVGASELQSQTQNLIHGFLGLEQATAPASKTMFCIVMLNNRQYWGAARTQSKHELDPWMPWY